MILNDSMVGELTVNAEVVTGIMPLSGLVNGRRAKAGY
jgi:hypothetical protein